MQWDINVQLYIINVTIIIHEGKLSTVLNNKYMHALHHMKHELCEIVTV